MGGRRGIYAGIGSGLVVAIGGLHQAAETFPDHKTAVTVGYVGIAFVFGLIVGSFELGWHLGRKRQLKESSTAAGDDLSADPSPTLSLEKNRQGAAHRLVAMLHTRWFRSSSPDLDDRYRISMFVPVPDPVTPKSWRCLARTMDQRPAAEWPHVDNDESLSRAGVVMNVARQNAPLTVVGVPQERRSDAHETKAYFKRSYVNEETHKQRSWHFASLHATLARASNGTIMCILVVERRDGEPIETPPRPTNEEGAIDVYAEELQLAAEVWTKAWDVAR